MNSLPIIFRFAPSPTGVLHLGGVRTALYNFLLAKKQKGKMIIRIEDTDQTRWVEGAEEYIYQSLQWCGIVYDESPVTSPLLKQSIRKERGIYKRYAQQLIDKGFAYYAFDSPADLEAQRKQNPNFLYHHGNRLQLKNSLSLSPTEVQDLLSQETSYTIRIKIPPHEHIVLKDELRGDIIFDSSLIDDKILLKSDGMPTYHLAVVVDDKEMGITDVCRGEEWLPSAPIHILLWRYLFPDHSPTRWIHLPLILKPNGKGKLSKRDGMRVNIETNQLEKGLDFPISPLAFNDAKNDKMSYIGFQQIGFLPEAFINYLALLGWNNGSKQELFTLQELIEQFSISHIHHHGAVFDYNKAKWMNHEWIKRMPALDLVPHILQLWDSNKKEIFTQEDTCLYKMLFQKTSPGCIQQDIQLLKRCYEKGILTKGEKRFIALVDKVKHRCHLLKDFEKELYYLFVHLSFASDKKQDYQQKVEAKKIFFKALYDRWEKTDDQYWIESNTSHVNYCMRTLVDVANQHGYKANEVKLPLRLILVGDTYGLDVMEIILLLGKEETLKRINTCLHIE